MIWIILWITMSIKMPIEGLPLMRNACQRQNVTNEVREPITIIYQYDHKLARIYWWLRREIWPNSGWNKVECIAKITRSAEFIWGLLQSQTFSFFYGMAVRLNDVEKPSFIVVTHWNVVTETSVATTSCLNDKWWWAQWRLFHAVETWLSFAEAQPHAGRMIFFNADNCVGMDKLRIHGSMLRERERETKEIY